MRARWGIGLLGLLLCAACAAQTSQPAQPTSAAPVSPPRMLLPRPAVRSVSAMVQDHDYALLALTALSAKHPKPERLAAIGALTQLAEHGNAFAEYVLARCTCGGHSARTRCCQTTRR